MPPVQAGIRAMAPVPQYRAVQDGRQPLALVRAHSVRQVRMPEREADLARSVQSAHSLLQEVHCALPGGCVQLAKASLLRAP